MGLGVFLIGILISGAGFMLWANVGDNFALDIIPDIAANEGMTLLYGVIVLITAIFGAYLFYSAY